MPEIDLWKVFASLGVPGIVLGIFYMLFREFKWEFPQVPKKWVGPLIVLFMVLIASVTFYGLTLWAPSSGVTTIRISLLGINKMPIDEGQVWTSIGAEAKKVTGGWELEFASSKLPQDRKVIVYAAQRQAHLKGQREVTVEKGKTTPVSIQLERDTSAEESSKPGEPQDLPPPKLYDLFKSDFEDYFNAMVGWKFDLTDTTTGKKQTINFKVQIVCDFEGASQFLTVFLPSNVYPNEFRTCIFVADEFKSLINHFKNGVTIAASRYDEKKTELKDLKFTGRVYIYHEGYIPELKKDAIKQYYRNKNLDPIFRGSSYITTRWLYKKASE